MDAPTTTAHGDDAFADGIMAAAQEDAPSGVVNAPQNKATLACDRCKRHVFIILLLLALVPSIKRGKRLTDRI